MLKPKKVNPPSKTHVTHHCSWLSCKKWGKWKRRLSYIRKTDTVCMTLLIQACVGSSDLWCSSWCWLFFSHMHIFVLFWRSNAHRSCTFMKQTQSEVQDLNLLLLFILFFPFSVWLLPLNLRRTRQLNTMNAWVDHLYQKLYIWFIDHYYKDLQDIYIMWEMRETQRRECAAYRPFWVQMWLPCSLVMHQSVIRIRQYYRMLYYQYQRQWHHLLNSVLCCSLFTIPHINSCAAPGFSWRANMVWRRRVDSTFIALTVAKLLGTQVILSPVSCQHHSTLDVCMHAHLFHPTVILRVRLKTGQSENVLTINDISGAVTTLTLSCFTTNTSLANIYSWMYWFNIFDFILFKWVTANMQKSDCARLILSVA